jgi:hypothetical protein
MVVMFNTDLFEINYIFLYCKCEVHMLFLINL